MAGCVRCSLEAMCHLMRWEFTQHWHKTWVEVTEWLEWHFGVLTMLKGKLAINNCIGFNLEVRPILLDAPSFLQLIMCIYTLGTAKISSASSSSKQADTMMSTYHPCVQSFMTLYWPLLSTGQSYNCINRILWRSHGIKLSGMSPGQPCFVVQ